MSHELEQAERKAVRRAGLTWWNVEEGFKEMGESEKAVQSITVRLYPGEAREPLCIIKGQDVDGTPIVAFSGGHTGSEALATAMERFRNGDLKWRPERPYGAG